MGTHKKKIRNKQEFGIPGFVHDKEYHTFLTLPPVRLLCGQLSQSTMACFRSHNGATFYVYLVSVKLWRDHIKHRPHWSHIFLFAPPLTAWSVWRMFSSQMYVLTLLSGPRLCSFESDWYTWFLYSVFHLSGRDWNFVLWSLSDAGTINLILN